MLPLVGIAALMLFGFVLFMTALAYDERVKSDRQRYRALVRERQPPKQSRRTQARHALPARRSAVRELAVTLRTRAIALADEWWPRLRHHARDGRVRWLTLESTTGQVIAAAAASVIVAYLIVALG